MNNGCCEFANGGSTSGGKLLSVSLMLVGRHFGPSDIGKNLLPAQDDLLTDGVVLWVNQTGYAETYYSIKVLMLPLDGADIVGTDDDDRLIGTTLSETIYGLGGNDTLSGGLRNDTIDGGDGIDLVFYQGTHENYSVYADSSGAIHVTFIGPIPAIYPPPTTEGADLLQIGTNM